MANRQVRLDPDVEALVDSVRAELGTDSWAQATNTVLREVLAPTPDPDVRPPSTPGRSSGPARAVRAKGTLRRPRRPRGDLGPSVVGRSSRAKRTSCPHPVTRRIGDRCGVCGDQV